VSLNFTTEAAVDAALTRALTLRFRLGLFDDRSTQPYAQIPASVIGSAQHAAVALDAATQGIVLLKNDKNTLPFAPGVKVAVVGPHAVTQRELIEQYYGDVSGPCRRRAVLLVGVSLCECLCRHVCSSDVACVLCVHVRAFILVRLLRVCVFVRAHSKYATTRTTTAATTRTSAWRRSATPSAR
jgi:beta-glucosidase-like glycosyl hydrolase